MNTREVLLQAQSDGDLEDFFENGTIGLHLVAGDGTIVRANRAEYELLGYTAEEYIGQPIMKFHADDDVIADILSRLSSGQKLERYPARLRAKDGSIRHVEISSSVCFREGEFVNTRCFTVDVTDKLRAEAALRDAQERLSVTYETVLAGIAEADRDGRFTRVNEAFVKITGYSRDELLQLSFFDITHPDDIERDRGCYGRQVAGDIDQYSTEKRYVRKAGEAIWVEVNSSTVRDASGGFGYGVRMVQDITDRKLAEQHRKLLLAELNHRVKNTLATVQALAAHTARSAESVDDFQRSFEPRLLALSAAHDRLTKNDWRGADLVDIVREELRAHVSSGKRATFDGPNVMLPPRISLTLSMALHELATNALKYGALSDEHGRVAVRWHIEEAHTAGTPAILTLTWEERDGPAVEKPKREGFGSRLLRVTAAELKGKYDLKWEPHGLVWTVTFPLADSDFELAV